MRSAVFTEALAPVPAITSVEKACNNYAFLMRRFAVLINSRQESGDKEGEEKDGREVE